MVHLLQLQCSSSVHRPLFLFYILLLLLLLLLLLFTSSMEIAFSDARRLPLRLQAEDTGGSTDNAVAADNNKQQESSSTAVAARSSGEETTTEGRRRGLIGSRPPRCERVCVSCGHCEAVQVPIVPQQEDEKARAAAKKAVSTTLAAAMFTNRYRVEDGVANYKPLSWKCRCGGTIMDPYP